MSLPLATNYRRLHYEVMESDGVLWLGFKPGMVHAIVKEVWNEQPLSRTDAERYYTAFSSLSRGRGNPYFRIVAHGGFQPEAFAFELHGLAVSDGSYIRSFPAENISSSTHTMKQPTERSVKALNNIASVP